MDFVPTLKFVEQVGQCLTLYPQTPQAKLLAFVYTIWQGYLNPTYSS